jgi:6-phosphogluconolactonase
MNTDEPSVRVYQSADDAAAAAAELIADSLVAAVSERGRADWATTGGSTPVPIYRHLALSPLRDRVPWDRVHVWWGDDRLVPRDHPLSNRLAFDSILEGSTARAGMSGTGEDAAGIELGQEPGIAMPPANVHGMPIEATTTGEDAAARYAAELAAAPLDRDVDGFPILDIVLVGVGPDGHVFSVFPGSPLFDETAWVSAVAAPQHVEPHVGRVSLNPRILAAARLPLAVVLGRSKAGVVAKILSGERDVRQLPAQVARRGGAVWILDAESGAQLPARGA